MFISSIGTATPRTRYGQNECWEAISQSGPFQELSRRSQAILRKVLLSNNGIESRFLALDPLAEAFELDPDTLHERFAANAPVLAKQATQRALDSAGIRPEEIGALIISTCTGYLCPGLTSYVSEALGLRPDAFLLDLVGQGCGAALPNLKTASSLLASGTANTVVSACVEVSSAAVYLDDDPGVLISACLFGDGAAAAVLTRDPRPDIREVRWLHAETVLSARDRDFLRFQQRHGMLRNILASQVPAIAAGHAESVLRAALARTNVRREDIIQWITHAGGRDVLAALESRLRLDRHDLRFSREILRTHANMSSPFVLFVLKSALEEKAAGGYWWLSSFGAGFSSHGALLQVE